MKNYLKYLLLILLVIPIKVMAKPVNENFDDDYFFSCVLTTYNNRNKTQKVNLTDEELQSIDYLYCNEEYIKSVKGIEKLTNLKNLQIDYSDVSNLDLRQNLKLEVIRMDYANELESVNLTANSLLESLRLFDTKLVTIDLSHNENLNTLYLTNSSLANIDVSKNQKLKDLNLSNNQLSSILLTNNKELGALDLNGNKLTSIDLSANPNLEYLVLENNNLSTLNLKNNLNLKILKIRNNEIASIDLSYLKNITHGQIDAADSFTSLEDYSNLSSQALVVKVTRKDQNYTLNLNDLSKDMDLTKVKINSTDTIKYDEKKGIITFTKLPQSMSYVYKTGLPSESGISDDMLVNINLIDGGLVGNDDSNLPENPATGMFIPITSLIVLSGLSLLIYILINKSKKA